MNKAFDSFIKENRESIENKDANKLIDSLSDKDKQKLNSLLNNEDELKKILSSPEAKMLIALLGGKNG